MIKLIKKAKCSCLRSAINHTLPIKSQWCINCFHRLTTQIFSTKTKLMMQNYMILSLKIKDMEYRNELYAKCLSKINQKLHLFKSHKLVNNRIGTNTPYGLIAWIQTMIRNQYINDRKQMSRKVKHVSLNEKTQEMITKNMVSHDNIEDDFAQAEKNIEILKQITQFHAGNLRNIKIYQLHLLGFKNMQISSHLNVSNQVVKNVLFDTKKYLNA